MKAMLTYALGILVVLGLIAFAALRTLDRMVAAAKAERDAHWTAEIARSNAEAEAARLADLERMIAVETDARDRIAEAERKAAELEKDNEALPDAAACGLTRDRVRLLNK